MDNRERARLMDAVLDGEATPDEAKALDRLLAADPSARADFEQLKRVFDGLRRIPQAFPPEGLVASVLSNIPQNGFARGGKDQLSSRSRVIRAVGKEPRGTSPGTSVKGSQVPHLRGLRMNEHSSGSRRRNVWIGSSIAIAAALIALAYTIDFPPGAQSVVGTIVPAQRFKAAQPAMGDIKGGTSAASQSVPLQTGSAANAATNSAVSAGTVNATNTGITSAVNTNTTMNAVDNVSTNAVVGGVVNQSMQNALPNAIGRSTGNAVVQSKNNAVNEMSMNAATQSASNALNQSTNSSINSAVQSGVTNAINGSNTNAVMKQ